MSSPRFNHVFLSLMSLAFVCAFVLPQELLNPARLNTAGLFNPLSYPLRRLTLAVTGPFVHRDALPTTSSPQSLSEENDQLRQQIVQLQATVDRLQKLEAEREKLGDLKALCVRVPVSGGDAGGRDDLILSVPSGVRLADGEAVLYSGGLAGRLEWSPAGSRVRLITDDGLAVTAAFIRFVETNGVVNAVRLNGPAPLVQGQGHGRLEVAGMKWSDCQAAGLAAGDWLILDDSQWPKAVQGVRLGRIVRIEPRRTAPLFADIRLATDADLTRLPDVWVLAAN
jgi:cell shape-determining protein MreC